MRRNSESGTVWFCAVALTALLAAGRGAAGQEHGGPHGQDRGPDSEFGKRGRGPFGRRVDQRVKQRVVQEVLMHIRRDDPAEYKRLIALREKDPAAFRAEMERAAREKLAGRWNRRTEEDLLCDELAKDYERETDPEKRKELQAALKQAVEAAFDRRLQEQIAQLEAWEQRVEQLRTRLELRKKNRAAICERRLQDLVSGPDLRW